MIMLTNHEQRKKPDKKILKLIFGARAPSGADNEIWRATHGTVGLADGPARFHATRKINVWCQNVDRAVHGHWDEERRDGHSADKLEMVTGNVYQYNLYYYIYQTTASIN